MSILSMLVAASVTGQDKPDFSGRWILENSSGAGPDVARSLTVRQPVVRTNVYGAPIPPSFKDLSVERQFVSGVRAETYQIGVEGGIELLAPLPLQGDTKLWVEKKKILQFRRIHLG